MKKLLSLLLALILLVSLAACSAAEPAQTTAAPTTEATEPAFVRPTGKDALQGKKPRTVERTDVLRAHRLQICHDHVQGDQPCVSVKERNEKEERREQQKYRRTDAEERDARGKDRCTIRVLLRRKAEDPIGNSHARQGNDEICRACDQLCRAVLRR